MSCHNSVVICIMMSQTGSQDSFLACPGLLAIAYKTNMVFHLHEKFSRNRKQTQKLSEHETSENVKENLNTR